MPKEYGSIKYLAELRYYSIDNNNNYLTLIGTSQGYA